MNKFVRTNSPTGSKFSEIFFERMYTGWSLVVHLYCGFSLWRQMAPQQSAIAYPSAGGATRFGKFCKA